MRCSQGTDAESGINPDSFVQPITARPLPFGFAVMFLSAESPLASADGRVGLLANRRGLHRLGEKLVETLDSRSAVSLLRSELLGYGPEHAPLVDAAGKLTHDAGFLCIGKAR